jgi:hypothetical protein
MAGIRTPFRTSPAPAGAPSPTCGVLQPGSPRLFFSGFRPASHHLQPMAAAMACAAFPAFRVAPATHLTGPSP